MTTCLKRIRIRGFRSLRDVELADITPATLLIGPNGSGKSNLLGAIEMLRLLANGGLGNYVGRQGGASSLLHYGPKFTPVIDLEVEFSTDNGDVGYRCRLEYAAGETLFVSDEVVGRQHSPNEELSWTRLGSGQRESRLANAEPTNDAARSVRSLLRRMSYYHFHDTSPHSKLRTHAPQSDDRHLQSDGSNLASFLFALKTSDDDTARAAFWRIEGLIRQIAPFIHELDPTAVNGNVVRLDWIDDRKERFGSAHLSDGTLRAIALFTALGQRVDQLPLFSVIDEPELGLHPAAVDLFCELVRSATAHVQVMLATQSTELLDHFDVNEVVVAERIDHATRFRRLDPEEYAEWLEDYSLSELYDKNVLGGRP